MLTLGLTLSAASRSSSCTLALAVSVPAGAGDTTVDLSLLLDERLIALGVYPDINFGSTTTLTVVSPDGSDAFVTRGATDYLLGGTARFRVELADIALAPRWTEAGYSLALAGLGARAFTGAPTLTALSAGGDDLLGLLAVDTPAAAVNVNTRAAGIYVGGADVLVADRALFIPGEKWMLVYEITAQTDPAAGAVYAANGTPFALGPSTTRQLTSNSAVGKHAVMLTVRTGFDPAGGGTVSVLKNAGPGTRTFAEQALYRAEWIAALPTRGPEVASTTGPVTVTGAGGAIVSPSEPLEIGARYEFIYTVETVQEGAAMFTPANTAFAAEADPPATVGMHKVVWTCESASTDPFLKNSNSNDITFSALSLKKVIPAPAELTATVTINSMTASVTTPRSAAVYVATTGDDATGDGSASAPYATPQMAASLAQAGDTIYLAAGTYGGFRLPTSANGRADAPITFTTAADDKHLAIIDGVNFDAPLAIGVDIRHSDHVHVRNLTVQNWSQNCIAFSARGAPDGETHGGYVVADCVVRYCGQSGIYVEGYQPWNTGEKPIGTVRIRDVLIERNDVSYTNMVTPHNLVGNQDFPGGSNEAISVVAAVNDVVTRFNDIHDSRQYGIDYKHGVNGGAIHDNRIWNIYRYGLYIDSAVADVQNIEVYRNLVWGCDIGISIAREGKLDPGKTPVPAEFQQQTIRNITVRDNVVWNCKGTGLFIAPHPGDGPFGFFEDVAIRNNVFHNCGREDATKNEARLVDLLTLTDPDHPRKREDIPGSVAVVRNISFTDNIVSRTPDAPNFFDQWSGKVGFTVTGNDVGVRVFDWANIADAADVTAAETSGYLTPANFGQWTVGSGLVVNGPGYVEGDPEWEDPAYEPYMTEAEAAIITAHDPLDNPAA